MRLNGAGPVVLILAFVAGVYFFWGGTGWSETFRYKLTINVRVDGKPYSASSVIEARQVIGVCLLGNARCIPDFSAKGVAPMIMLPDGASIYASLRGYYAGPNQVGGVSLGRLPWLIYLDDWPKGNTLARLPEHKPRVEIPFDGHPKSKYKPNIRIAVPKPPQMPEFSRVGLNGPVRQVGKNVRLVSFTLAPTDEPLKQFIEPAPPWLERARSMQRFRGTISSLETSKNGD